MSVVSCATPDLAAVSEALSRPGVTGVRIATPVRPGGQQEEPRSRPFAFRHRGRLDDFLPELRRHLRRLELDQGSGLPSEVCFWLRWFSSLTGDRSPQAVVCTADSDVGAWLRDSEGNDAGLTMVAQFARGERGCRELYVFHGAAAAHSTVGPCLPRTWLLVSRTAQQLPPRELPETGTRTADVVLVSMPFAPLHQPSLGLSMLAATIPGRAVRVLYPALRFAERIGTLLYESIADGEPMEPAMVGDWLFSHEVFDKSGEADAAYFGACLGQISPSWLQALECVRAQIRPFLDSCLREIVAREPKLVGLSSIFQQHTSALALAKRIRRGLPNCRIVFGGANCEGAMGLELVHRFDFIDAAVSGEAEQVFPALVDAALADRPFPRLTGVHVRGSRAESRASIAQSVTDMDSLPYPEFGDFYEQWGRSPTLRGMVPRLFFESSRGCWWGQKHHCTFCGLNGANMQYRSKSGERAFRELKHLASSYPSRSIQVVDNILDMKYFETFVPRLEQEGLQLDLYYEVKANLRREQVEQLARAGVRSLQPGIESLSDPILRLMKKGVTALQNIQLLRMCGENGVRAYWNLIWGFPGEPEAEYRRMAELVPLLTHLTPPVACGPLRLDRFSPNFDRPVQHGFRDVRPRAAYFHIYPFNAASVMNLAYFFEFEHADGRQPERYAEELEKAVAEWKLVHPDSALLFVDKGDVVLVFDQRPVARSRLSTFAGTDRAVLLASCNRIHTEASLRDLFADLGDPADAADLEESVARLVDARLAIRDGDRFLGLPLDAASIGNSLDQREHWAGRVAASV